MQLNLNPEFLSCLTSKRRCLMIPVLISYTYCWTFAFSRSRARPYRSKHFMFLRYTSWLYFDRLYSLFWQNQYVQLFAANQNKPPDVVGILVTNRNKLLRLFADLKTEKGNNICMNEDTVLFMLYSLLFILIVALRNIKFDRFILRQSFSFHFSLHQIIYFPIK